MRSYLSLASSSFLVDSLSLCSASESFSSFTPGVALSLAKAFFLLSTDAFLSCCLCKAELLSDITVLKLFTCLEYSFIGSTNCKSRSVKTPPIVSSLRSFSATLTNWLPTLEPSSSFSPSLLKPSPKASMALKSFLCLLASLSAWAYISPMWVSKAWAYVFTWRYSGSSDSSAVFPVIREVVLLATPLKNFFAPRKPFLTAPVSALAEVTSSCQAVSAASRKNWSSEENFRTGWAHKRFTKTLRAWHLLSMKSVPMEYF
mmetsp:Transcript_14548/g.41473  ORF Transcript_14548/g.41473 Transcript_14548/m.41473 type:complete len:259 (-) Transcript_14548:3114-3890(-)